MKDKSIERPWHAMGRKDVLAFLGVDERGLSAGQVGERLEKYGPNLLPQEDKPSALRRFMMQFKNVLIYVLLVAAVLTLALGEFVDSAVIFAVVIINAIIGFIQEGKAERAMEAIRAMLSPKALVVRDGKEQDLPARDLVPGDIVMVRSGDRVPADLRIVSARNAQAEEAALTGESEPVDKQVDPVETDAPLGDRFCMAYSSTVITSGQLRGVVVATGGDTEIGRIGAMVSGVEQITTPLIRKINAFGHALSLAIILVSAAVFLFGYFVRGFDLTEIFMAVVSLAVAAIPEGLPAVMTITLALGVQRMAKRNAIVRRLPAVETLGSVTVICSDKTGTLTRNEMTVKKVITAGRLYEIGGVGYEPVGDFVLDGHKIDPQEHPRLMELARAGLLASEAGLNKIDGKWVVAGMPTEGGVVVLGHKAGMTREKEQQTRPRLDMIPFESERRYMASLHKDPDGRHVMYVKGAPERILGMCAKQCTEEGEEPLEKESWVRREEELAAGGHRVLAIAAHWMDGNDTINEEQVQDLTLLGMVGIIDPPREEAIEAIRQCQEAGIRVKMITGDHLLTARSIGAAMGIGDGTHAISGKDLEHLDEREMVRLVNENDVFARSSPEHKLRMMEALQSSGQVVAMTGDGVNDAPALKRADVGVAMGIKGSEATKEAADIVLADDNFATIERAVEEGRTIYDNLIKAIIFIIPTNGAEALVVIASVLFLFEVMPITPLQILWVNMITAVTLALALSFEPAEAGIMQRPPRKPHAPIISRYLLWRIGFVSVLIATATIILFYLMRAAGESLAQSRTVAVNTLVAGQIFYLFNSRFIQNSSLSFKGFLGNSKALIAVAVLVVFQLAFTYFGPLQFLFGTEAIQTGEWLLIIAGGAAVFLLVEIEKALFRKYRHTRGERRRQARPGEQKEEKRTPTLPEGKSTPFKPYKEIFDQELSQAVEELQRPTSGLLISGLIAGTIIGLSLMLMGVMQTLAGEVHEFWRVTIEANAYAAGLIIIIMARTDLFTEYTTIATLPLLTGNARTSSVARLWVIIYAANLIGGALFTLLLSYIGPALGIIHLDVFARKALQLAQQPWTVILASAFVTGWLMGLLAWLVVAVRDSISQVFFIWLIAAIIAFSHLHHVIIGGIEVLLAILGSQALGWNDFGHFMLWTTLGNIVGSFVFALLIRFGFLLHRRE